MGHVDYMPWRNSWGIGTGRTRACSLQRTSASRAVSRITGGHLGAGRGVKKWNSEILNDHTASEGLDAFCGTAILNKYSALGSQKVPSRKNRTRCEGDTPGLPMDRGRDAGDD